MVKPAETTKPLARRKRAELLSSLGAMVLGAGLALQFGGSFAAHAEAIIGVGLLAHAIGMFRVHQAERAASQGRIAWVEALYWLCWILLAYLGFAIVVSMYG